VPEGVGVSVSNTAFFSECKMFGQKEESFVMPLNTESDDYEMAPCRIRLEALFLVNDLGIKRA
jgi:predicted membrane protein